MRTWLYIILVIAGVINGTSLADEAVGARPVQISHDGWQNADDIQMFDDYLRRYGDRPPLGAVDRVIARAVDRPHDASANFYGAEALLQQRDRTAETTVRATGWLRAAAASGFAPAMNRLAVQILRREADDEPAIAVQLLQNAAKQGDSGAERNLGALFLFGIAGTPKNLDGAILHLARAWSAGYLPAAEDLARLYWERKDTAASLAWFERAADSGDHAALMFLANYYGGTSPPRDAVRAVKYLENGALWGDPEAQRVLALDLASGALGMNSDNALSFALLTRAARSGNSAALTELAKSRLEGKWRLGVPPDKNRAVRELTRLSDLKGANGEAAYLLGHLFLAGTEWPKDEARGRQLLRHAAAQKWRAAETELAALGEAAAPAAGPELPATQPDPLEQQRLEDEDAMRDWWYWLQDFPTEETIRRVVLRAREKAPDLAAMAWGSMVGFSGQSSMVKMDEAASWLERAADAGYPVAMSFYGYSLAIGKQYHRDLEVGEKMLRAAMEKGEPMAAGYLGMLSLDVKPGAKTNFSESVKLLTRATSLGSHRMIYTLADAYDRHGEGQEAFRVLREAAELGDKRAILRCAHLQNGREKLLSMNGPYEFKDAWNHIFCRGAMFGVPSLMTAVASIEDAIPANRALCRVLLRRAAATGDSNSKAVLAGARISGRFGIPVDSERGTIELENLVVDPETPDGGRIEAEWQLGRVLFADRNSEANRQKGEALILRAAQDHHPSAEAWRVAHDTRPPHP